MNFPEYCTAIVFRAPASFVCVMEPRAAPSKKIMLLKLRIFEGKRFYINILFRLNFSQENKKKLLYKRNFS